MEPKEKDNNKKISKLLSYVLRHHPDQIGLRLDKNGWADTNELIEKINNSGTSIDLQLLETIVATNDKKRFAFNEDKSRIRASQGHSLEIDLQLTETKPPDVLYHGTTTRFLDSIMATGLQKQSRQHVHLSETIETAKAVGSRHGVPVLLTIKAGDMHKSGYKFYLSANHVWLTHEVPASFLELFT